MKKEDVYLRADLGGTRKEKGNDYEKKWDQWHDPGETIATTDDVHVWGRIVFFFPCCIKKLNWNEEKSREGTSVMLVSALQSHSIDGTI